jgi:hypothetical protein
MMGRWRPNHCGVRYRSVTVNLLCRLEKRVKQLQQELESTRTMASAAAAAAAAAAEIVAGMPPLDVAAKYWLPPSLVYGCLSSPWLCCGNDPKNVWVGLEYDLIS